jgi:hypothetical protein
VAGNRISCEVAGRYVSQIKGTSMRKLISVTMLGVVVMGFGMSMSGCSDDSSKPADKPASKPAEPEKPKTGGDTAKP